jgi:hypothetical protein
MEKKTTISKQPGSSDTPTQPRLLTRRLTLTNVDIRDEYIDEERICEGKNKIKNEIERFHRVRGLMFENKWEWEMAATCMG